MTSTTHICAARIEDLAAQVAQFKADYLASLNFITSDLHHVAVSMSTPVFTAGAGEDDGPCWHMLVDCYLVA